MEDKEYLHMYEEEEHHWWYVGMRTIVLAFLPPDHLPANPHVLDAGCGTGYNIGWFRDNYGARVTGIDYSALGLDFCRRRGEHALACANIASLPFSAELFDLVASLDVLPHLNEAARAQALREFRRVLKPRGRLLIRAAAHEWLRSTHDEVTKTHHRFEKRELLKEVAAAGLRVLRITSANSILFPCAVMWRMLKKAGIAPGGSDVSARTRGGNRLNQLMASILKGEAAVLRRGRWNFPFGLSILLLADKFQD